MEMQITAGGFTRSITVNVEQVGQRKVGGVKKGFTWYGGEYVPVFRAYCDQLSLVYTEGDTPSVAIEKMRLEAIAIYNGLAA
jgi:hypothetical protein